MLLTTTKTRFNNSILAPIPQMGTDEHLNVTLSFDENGVCTNYLSEDEQQLAARTVPDLEYVFVESEVVAPPVDPNPPVESQILLPHVIAGVDPALSNPPVDIVPVTVGEPVSATVVPATIEPIVPEIPVVKTIEEQKADTRTQLEALEFDQLQKIAVQSGMNRNAVNKATKAGIIEYLVAKVQ